MSTLLIGIDPGVKTGLAAWVPEENRFQTIETMSIVRAMNWIMLARRDGMQVKVVFEDARLRTWFGRADREQLQGAGSIKRDCAIWAEFCEYHQIPFQCVKPAKGGTKWTADYFKRVTGWQGRTSVHGRDAGILVFGAK
jgi:hypothetical protein